MSAVCSRTQRDCSRLRGDKLARADMGSSYTLPLHSALVDFIGQLFLMVAYEVCIARGLDVQIALDA